MAEMTKDEALKMAIEALENIAFEYGQLLDGDQDYGMLPSETNEDIVIAYRVKRACKEALAEQPTQEPVAWMNDIAFSMDKDELTTEKFGDIIPLYTHPKEWQGLSDDEIIPMYNEPSSDAEMIEFARAIEAKLREKNDET